MQSKEEYTMKNKSKQLLAFLLTLVMLLSATPASSFAAVSLSPAATTASKTHKHKKVTTVKKATTSKDGLITVKCSSCKKILSKKTIAKIKTIKLKKSSYDYTGKAIKPAVTVKDSKGKTLKSGRDYTVTYTANKKPGKATAKITFKGNYSGSKSLSFTILPVINADILVNNLSGTADMNLSWGRVSGAATYTLTLYRGKKVVKSVKTAATEARFEKLSCGKKYRLVFTARNLLGKEILSDSASISVPKAAESEVPLSPSSTTKDIVDIYNKAVNTLKKEKKVKIRKTMDFNMECTEVSNSSMKPIINSALEKVLTPIDETLTFKDGKSKSLQGNAVSLNDFVDPSGKKAALNAKYVKSASTKLYMNGNTELTIVLKKETSTTDGKKTTSTAKGNSSVIDVTDVATLSDNLIASSKLVYTGTTLKATLNKNGKLIKLTVNVPLTGVINGNLSAGLKMTSKFEGNRKDTYRITY